MTRTSRSRETVAKVLVVVMAAVASLLVAVSCATTAGEPNPNGGRTAVCGDGLTECSPNDCRDLDVDSTHCGSCSVACQVGQECHAGACQCFAPYTSCGGGCISLQSDPANCGACSTACAQGLFCSLGACSDSCATGLIPCGAACVNVQTDALNCGACASACGSGQACANGACVCTAPGQQVCGGQCIDTQTNSLNCGTCGMACPAGQTCSQGLCSGGGGTGGTGSGTGGTGTSGNAGSGGGGSGGGTGSGYQIGGTCFPACASDVTDPDEAGVRDGYGYEMGRSCVVTGSAPTLGVPRCEPPPIADGGDGGGIPPGDGFYVGGMCHPRCASDATDPDTMGVRDGWGYEMGRSCIVVGSAPAMMGVPCIPDAAPMGDGWLVDTKCVGACTHPEWADAQGYGYEAQQTCVVTGSTAATQNARCMIQPRTDLPPPGTGFQNGETCYAACTGAATEVSADGYGWEMNRTCIVPGSKGAVQGVPCVPPPSTVTGDCPRTLTCPNVNGTTLACGCTWVDGLAERKAVIMGTSGSSQYFLASAMMETVNLLADYTLGDGKTQDAFNAGIAKQNWGMIRRCHPAWQAQTAAQFMTSTAMNSSLSLDITVYNECRTMFGTNWWSAHRAGYNNLGMNTQDIQEFKAAMDWTNTQLTGHLADDVRFWVTVRPI